MFVGPAGDAWPGQAAWRALREGAKAAAKAKGGLGGVLFEGENVVGPDADAVKADYYAWRIAQEREWLNAMGQAQFELVAVYRDENRGPDTFPRWTFSIVTVHCYFKRLRVPDLPIKPRIGFDPERAVQRGEAGE